MPLWQEIGLVAHIKESTMFARNVAGKDCIFIREGDKVYCYEDRCSHQDLRLSEFGALRQGVLVCHAHGARFRLRDGGPVMGPAECPLKRYDVQVVNGHLFVDMDSGSKEGNP